MRRGDRELFRGGASAAATAALEAVVDQRRLARVRRTDDVRVEPLLPHGELELVKELGQPAARLAADEVHGRGGWDVGLAGLRAHPPLHLLRVHAPRQQVHLVADKYERVRADDEAEIWDEGAVEIEEIDDGDDDAALAPDGAQEVQEILGLQRRVRRFTRAHPQRVDRQTVLVAKPMAALAHRHLACAKVAAVAVGDGSALLEYMCGGKSRRPLVA
mmetsp:Transcript_18672/g.47728  ORF Transcript_18672/g.47728 Transcript_18672/m.47728 type:complete len:217 (-) Transcript_18672:426-1076(-)